MTIRYANPSTLPSPSGVIDFNMFIPHASSMHILIKIAMRWTAETPTEEGRKALLELTHARHRPLRQGNAHGERRGHAAHLQNAGSSQSLARLARTASTRVSTTKSATGPQLYSTVTGSRHSLARDPRSTPSSNSPSSTRPRRRKCSTKCISRLDENSLELRERIMTVLGDINNDNPCHRPRRRRTRLPDQLHAPTNSTLCCPPRRCPRSSSTLAPLSLLPSASILFRRGLVPSVWLPMRWMLRRPS
ncbi:hypothetical protein PMAYCL1PPCAC_33341, partial [Pristionchus mayeri]